MTDDGGVYRVAERLAEANQESLRALSDGAIAVQRQNVRLFRGWVETSSVLVEESVRMCMAFSYAPFSYVPETGPRGGNGEEVRDLPVTDYDRLSVEEAIGRLEGLSAREVEELEAYEKRHKNRRALLERMDRSLV